MCEKAEAFTFGWQHIITSQIVTEFKGADLTFFVYARGEGFQFIIAIFIPNLGECIQRDLLIVARL